MLLVALQCSPLRVTVCLTVVQALLQAAPEPLLHAQRLLRLAQLCTRHLQALTEVVRAGLGCGVRRPHTVELGLAGPQGRDLHRVGVCARCMGCMHSLQ